MKRVSPILFLILIASPAYALEVQEIRWGYNDKVLPARVNLLSALLVNPTENPYEGAVVLYKTDALGGRLGAQYIQPCYVSPFSSRWLQFYVYISQEEERWVLTWGKGQINAPEVRLGAPARVLLYEPESLFSTKTDIKTFPDNLFPPSVSATDALHSVVLDYCPKWESARREAFLDWLRRGGTVHLLKNSEGDYPQFSSDLSQLNNPLDQFRVGAGLVVRHPFPRQKVSEELLQERGFPALQLKTGESVRIYNLEREFFRQMRNMTRPEHNWSLISFLIIGYMILICPVNYLFARKRRRDFWMSIALLLALVACFALIFYVVGRRGYGEVATVHTISYARYLGGDTYDVTQWSNVFVTSGDYYTISHPASHNIYCTCEDSEAVRGIINNGRDGNFRVDIPLYSSRALMHRAKMKGVDIIVEIIEWEGEDQLTELALAPSKGFPKDVAEIYVLYQSRFYKMELSDSLLKIDLDAAEGEDFDQFLSRENLQISEYYLPFYYDEHSTSSDLVFQKMSRVLIARSLGGTGAFMHYIPEMQREGSDRAQLFVYARSPENFHPKGKGLGREIGYVLYHQDLLKPESGKD